MPELPLSEIIGLESAEDQELDESLQIGADPFAAGMAMNQAQTDRSLAAAATSYFERQTRLSQLQQEHLHEQRALNVGHLRARRLKDAFQLTSQSLVAVVSIIAAIVLVIMLKDAIGSRSVIIDPFETPSQLNAQGLSGKVVAGSILDALGKLQQATRSVAAKRHVVSAWTGDIKIEVPETGVSFGEIDRLLRERLGHDQHVSGDLVTSPSGALTLTVRGEGVAASSFTGPAASLDHLVTQAAEFIYGSAEPLLFANYLVQVGRNTDAESFLAHAYPTATEQTRGEMAVLWGNALLGEGKYAESAAKYRLAIDLNPRLWRAWGNQVGAMVELKHEEAGYKIGHDMVIASDASPRDDRPLAANWINFDILSQDLPTEVAHLEEDSRQGDTAGTAVFKNGPELADAAARMHDWAGAERYLIGSDPDDSNTATERLFIAGFRALDDGAPASAVKPLEAFYAPLENDPAAALAFGDSACWLGYAYALSGRQADAERIFQKTGSFVSCKTFRADGLDKAGNWPAATRAYAEAVLLAPDLSLAYDHWGLALLRRGETAKAITMFRAANAHSPHWADPLMHWGDALKAQGHTWDARGKYQEAKRFAPHWEALNTALSHAPLFH